jgi:hypothetical protein
MRPLEPYVLDLRAVTLAGVSQGRRGLTPNVRICRLVSKRFDRVTEGRQAKKE